MFLSLDRAGGVIQSIALIIGAESGSSPDAWPGLGRQP